MECSSSDAVREGFALLCNLVSTPYAVKALSLFREEEVSLALLEMPQPSSYPNAYAFANDYYVYSFLRKYKEFPIDARNRADAALSKWNDSEDLCYQTNQYIRAGEFSPTFSAHIAAAKETIAKVLGRFSYVKVLTGCDIGPGAVVGLDRRRSRGGRKLVLPLTVSFPCKKFADAWIFNDPFISSTSCFASTPMVPTTVVPGGELLTVPKRFDIDRVIDKQPAWNLWFQKGAGRYMRKRLKSFGVDLDSQTRNRTLARDAYKCGYATIDLSSASDCISKSLIHLLLSYEWYQYLDDIRTSETFLKIPEYGIEERLALQKFASMGNGFTFELETLIFWALLGPENVLAVYGDDIVVAQNFYDTAVAILSEAGFPVNKEKSYHSGPFFESCGGHFFQGYEVTPVFQKEEVQELHQFVRAANRWFKACIRHHDFFLEDSIEGKMYAFYKQKARDIFGTKVPEIPHPGDDRGFLNWSREHLGPYDPNRGYRCYVLVPKRGRRVRTFEQGLYWHKLWDSSKASALDLEGTLRFFGEGIGYRVLKRWIPLVREAAE